MKITELREKTKEELITERRDLKQEMMNLYVQRASGQLENPARIKLVRKTLARIETLLSMKAIEERKAAAGVEA
ncbi:MAG: 50S ribosomal protein L29 [Verrucomicrobiales bacterium]|jgi:large subunit ribosomal protein L29|nr:50S ribosomal protein L29 [Verrucomicrobiales bacterium]|tara:strand:+ start:133 stop:354 length:222 start_codon:yes stop_codon:yes gene_type:complete